jgi:hypothetical protein
MISETLRHWPDLARSKARSIAGLLVIAIPLTQASGHAKMSVRPVGHDAQVPKKRLLAPPTPGDRKVSAW